MSGKNTKVSPKVATATPIPLKVNETSSTRKADKAGFSSTDLLVSAAGSPRVELNPTGETTHVATPEDVNLWG